MNNPMQFIQAIRNPQQFVQGMMQNSQMMQNPMIKNAMDMYQKGDIQGLETLVGNVAKERGTSIDDIRKQLGI